jgi:hypothetical protein
MVDLSEKSENAEIRVHIKNRFGVTVDFLENINSCKIRRQIFLALGFVSKRGREGGERALSREQRVERRE